jgi:hypothetical protein
VADLLEDFNLSGDSLDVLLVLNLFFLKNFNCNLYSYQGVRLLPFLQLECEWLA